MESSNSAAQPTFWRKCSACKRAIGFSQKYQVCSVSTCTKKRSGFAFCSVPCWASHVPTFRHRDAWAIEEVSPSLQMFLAELKAEETAVSAPSVASGEPKRIIVGQSNSSTQAESSSDADVLVVVSKMKAYIKAKADMNTSGDVVDLLSDRIRAHCDGAIRRARADGRKTVMARDFSSVDSAE